MADENKDRTNQGTLSGSTQTGLNDKLQGSTTTQAGGTQKGATQTASQFGSSPQSASTQPGGATGTSSGTFGSASGTPGTGASGTSSSASGATGGGLLGTGLSADAVKETGARVASEAKQYAGDMANKAKEKGRTMFDQQKETAVGQVDSVARAFRNTADHLQGEGQAQVGRYIAMAADQIEAFGSRLRQKDLDTLIDDAQNMARRSPGVFLAGSIVAGFLVARFLKSSSENQYLASGGGGTGYGDWNSSGVRDDDIGMASSGRYGGMSTASGMGTTTGTGIGAAGVSGTITDENLTGTESSLGTGGTGTGTGIGSTTGTGLGTTGTGLSPSPLNGSHTGGSSYDNR
jgi:hypothetical protein